MSAKHDLVMRRCREAAAPATFCSFHGGTQTADHYEVQDASSRLRERVSNYRELERHFSSRRRLKLCKDAFLHEDWPPGDAQHELDKLAAWCYTQEDFDLPP